MNPLVSRRLDSGNVVRVYQHMVSLCDIQLGVNAATLPLWMSQGGTHRRLFADSLLPNCSRASIAGLDAVTSSAKTSHLE
nr:hypothetical protein HmN_000716900 [Hymenolepis microstoma]